MNEEMDIGEAMKKGGMGDAPSDSKGDLEILHDKENKKFYTMVEGLECLAEYKENDGVLDFHKTFTPESLRRRGIAAAIYEHAAQYVAANKLKVNPTCSYAAKFFSQEKYKGLMAGKPGEGYGARQGYEGKQG
jgi:hypothetical protein